MYRPILGAKIPEKGSYYNLATSNMDSLDVVHWLNKGSPFNVKMIPWSQYQQFFKNPSKILALLVISK